MIDKEAAGMTGIRKYSNAVVNRGESYILDEGKWMDWVDYIPTFKRAYASVYTRTKEEWLAVDNFSIKAYADYISRDLAAEAAKIGSGEPASTVGVSDEDAAKKDALVPLALVHNEISNNTTAAKASSVEKGYISAEDYDYIVKTLIDPDRATGLKVVVSSKEITDSDLEQQELDKFIEAADYKIARYADISLLVVALDTGEYLGSLHRTDDPIDLAIAIPSDVIALDAPVYVLRLHNGVVERLATTVRDGLACFASDLDATVTIDAGSTEHGTDRYEIHIHRDSGKALRDLFREESFYDEEFQITMPYKLYVPGKYDRRKKYPLVICLHGTGEVQEPLDAVLMKTQMATAFAKNSEAGRNECFVLRVIKT